MPRRRGWLLVVFPIRGWTPATGQAVLPASESMKMMKIQQWAVKNLCRLLASRRFHPAGYVYSYLIHTEAIWSSSARRTDLSSQRNAGNWQFLAIPQGSDRFDPFNSLFNVWNTFFFRISGGEISSLELIWKRWPWGFQKNDLPFSRLLREAISVMCSTCHLRV